MILRVVQDFSKGRNGAVALTLVNPAEEGGQDQVVDCEYIRIRHPFLLRLRMALGLGRMLRRQKKLQKFIANVNEKHVVK